MYMCECVFVNVYMAIAEYVSPCVYVCLLKAGVVCSFEACPNYFFKDYFMSCTITKVSEFLSYVQLMF